MTMEHICNWCGGSGQILSQEGEYLSCSCRNGFTYSKEDIEILNAFRFIENLGSDKLNKPEDFDEPEEKTKARTELAYFVMKMTPQQRHDFRKATGIKHFFRTPDPLERLNLLKCFMGSINE